MFLARWPLYNRTLSSIKCIHGVITLLENTLWALKPHPLHTNHSYLFQNIVIRMDMPQYARPGNKLPLP